MIYIFEDRHERKNTNLELVNSYNDNIQFAQFDIESHQELRDFVTDKFEDAECVIFHKSYSIPSNRNDIKLSDILAAFKEKCHSKIIIFSGGTEGGSLNEDGDTLVNADVMYSNLELFLRSLKMSGHPTYEILIWGENHRLSQRLSNQMEVHINEFMEKDLTQVIDSDELEDLIIDIATNGFDIEEEVALKLNSSKENITLNDIRKIVQNQID